MDVVANKILASISTTSLSSSFTSSFSSIERMDEGTTIKSYLTSTNDMIDNISSCNSNIEELNKETATATATATGINLIVSTVETISNPVAMNGSGVGNSNCFKSINSNKTAIISNSSGTSNNNTTNNNSETMAAANAATAMVNCSSSDNLQWYDFKILK